MNIMKSKNKTRKCDNIRGRKMQNWNIKKKTLMIRKKNLESYSGPENPFVVWVFWGRECFFF